MISGEASSNNIDQLKREKNEKLEAAQIKKDIVGDWTLVASHNVDAYLAEKKLGKFHDATFLAYDQCYLVNGREVSQLHLIGNEVVGQLHERIGATTKEPHYTRRTTVQEDGTVLRTMETWYYPDRVFKGFANENRFMKDGLLYVVNETKKGSSRNWECVSCTRVYKKVDRSESNETLKTGFNGTWRPVANARLNEYCKIKKIKGYTKRFMEYGHVSLNVLSFFNEFHCNLFLPYTPFEQKHTGRLDKDFNGFITSFNGDQLVTVGHGCEIVRVVKNDKLFITNYKDGSSYMIIYEKV